MHIEIRSLQRADIGSLAAFYKSVITSTYEGLISESILAHFNLEFLTEEWTTYFNEKKGTALLLFIDGKLSGFCSSTRSEVPGVDIRLESLYVAKELIGQGYGSLLFAKMVDDFRLQGYASTYLFVLEQNEPALRYYLQLGGAQSAAPIERHFFDETLYSYMFTWRDLNALSEKLGTGAVIT